MKFIHITAGAHGQTFEVCPAPLTGVQMAQKLSDPEVRERHAFAQTFGPQPGTKWRHYRGGLYTVIDCGLDSETCDAVVIYANDEERHYIWVRTLDSWLQVVEGDEGESTPRFISREV